MLAQHWPPSLHHPGAAALLFGLTTLFSPLSTPSAAGTPPLDTTGAHATVTPGTAGAGPTGTPGVASASRAPSAAAPWSSFHLGGTRFFGGISLGPAMTGFWPYGSSVTMEPAFFFALRLGVLFEHTELALEVAPMTWVRDFDPLQHSFSFNVSIGGLLQVAERAYWPFRFGLGLTTGDLPVTSVYMQGRLDLIGVAFNYGHLLFEISLPSTRFHSEFRQVGIWSWLFNISVSYVL